MPDNKQYYVQIPAEGDGQVQEKVVDAQSYENHKDELFNTYKNADVRELTKINPGEEFDYRPDDEFEVSLDDLGEKKVVSADQFVNGIDKLYESYPNASVTRRRKVNYWGGRLETLNKQIGQLEYNLGQSRNAFNETDWDINNEDLDTKAALDAARSSMALKDEMEVISKRLDKLYREREDNPEWQAGKVRQIESLNSSVADIDRRQEQLRKKNPKAVKAYWASHGASRGGMLTPVYHIVKKDIDAGVNRDIESYAAARLMYKDALETAKTPSRYDKTSGFGNFFRGLAGAADETFSPANLIKAGLDMHLVDAIKRIQDAEGKNANIVELIQQPEYLGYLSDGEKELVKAFVVKSAIDAQRAGDLSLGYQSGRTAAQAIPFMADFLMFGGIGEDVAKASTKWMTKGIAKTSMNMGLQGAKRELAMAVPKFLEGTLRSAVKTLVMSPLMPSSYANFTNSLLQINNRGGVDLSGEAILKTFFNDVFIENLSENAGGQVENILGFALKPVGAGARAIGRKALGDVTFDKWIKIYKNAPVTKLLKQAGFNGYIGEIGEEWYGNALRVFSGTDKDALKDFSTMENQIVTLTSFAPMSLIGLGGSLAQYRMSEKRLGQTAADLKAVLEKNGYTSDKIDNILAVAKAESPTLFSPKNIAKHLAPVINQVAKDNLDAAPEVFKAVCDYAKAVADWRVFDGVNESDVNDKRDAMFQEINNGVGAMNWYRSVESAANVEGSTEEDEPHKINFDYVRFIDDADRHRWFVQAETDGEIAMIDRNGQKSMMSRAKFEEGIASGELSDSGEMHMPQFLDMELTARDRAAEEQRMGAESQRNAQTLYNTAQLGTEVNLGTVESPNPGIIREIQPDRFIVEAADGVREVSPEQMAGYLGLPYRPKTDAEIENQQVSAEQRRADLRSRAQALAGTDIASILGIDGKATLVRVHNTPENEQQGLFQVDYEKGGEYNIAMVTEDQLAQIVAMGNQASAAVVKEEEAQEQQQRSDAPVDFRGNPLPMRTNSITGEQVVDGELLWKTDPEAWAYWNDTNPKQRTTSVERLDFTIKKVEGQIEKQEKDIHKASLEGVSDEQMDKMEYDLSQLQERAESLQGILNNYRRAERREARELAEPQTLDELAANGLVGMQHSLDREDFKRETGWSDTELNKFFPWWAKKGQGLTLKEVAERIAHDEGQTGLVPQDANADQPDVQAVRDAIIDILRSASVPSDITNYTRNANLARREQMEREAKAAEEAARLQAETEAAAAAQQQPAWPDGDMPDFENMETPLQAEISVAREQVDTNPTEAQKEAGNYAKGHLVIDGYNITLENPKGSTRSGVDASGKEWSQVMNNDYGYIRMTEGVDGDHIDVFLSDNPEQGDVFVVDQIDPQTGEFDEHKVMYGFGSAEQAREAYLANYEPGWKGLGTITEVSKEEFKKWIESSHRKTKPFADYKSVKPVGAQGEGAFDAALNKSLDIEQSWEERIADYIFEHYPTQATVSARTNSPEGRAEREAMKKDAVLQDMLEKQKAAMAAADADVRTALEAEKTSQPQAGVDLDATLADGGRTAILKRIDKWKKLLGNIFIVHDDISTIDDPTVLERIREFDSRVAAGEPRDVAAVRGWFDPATGTAHIYLPHLLEMSNRRRNLDETILHEVISHKGLRALFGKKYNAFLDVVWRDLMGPESRERELGYVNGSAQNVRDRRAAADEFLAHAAEGESAIVKQLDATWWQRLANAVKEFVNTTLGVDVFKDVSTEGFARLLQDAMKVLKKNGNSFDQVDSSKRFSFTDVRFPASVTKEQRETISKTLKDYTDQTQHQKVKEVCVDIDKRIEVENEEINGPILREIGDVRVRLKELNAQKGRIFQRNEGKENIPIINAEIQQLKTREKELRDSIKKVNLSAFDVKRRKDQAIIETGILDNDTWRGVGVVPTFELEVEKELKRMGWNGEDNMMYATEYGFVSHWEGHHPDMTESEVSYDMLRNMYEPTVVGFEARYPDTMLFIRNDENGLWYITAVKANHIKNDGSLLLATTYKDKENPSKKLARTLSLGRQKGTVASNQIHRSFNDHGAKVSKNSELASKYSKKEAQTLKTQDVLGSPKVEEMTEFSPETHEGTALFSVKDDKGKKTLVGIHNISAEKLAAAIRMGGLANPSAAVIDLSHQDHFAYADISLIMPSSLVDAKSGRNIGTFDRDAWTPMYPTVDYFSTKESDKKLKALTAGLPEALGRQIRYTFGMYMDKNTYNSGLEYLFLKEKGEETGIQTTPRRYPNLTLAQLWEMLGVPADTKQYDSEVWLTAYEALPEDKRVDFNIVVKTGGDPQKIARDREILADKNAKHRKMFREIFAEPMGFGPLDNFFYSLMKDERDAGKEDMNLTIAKAIDTVREKGYGQEFGEWQTKIIDDLGYEEKIFVGHTPSGNRKYVPNTLENVSKYMKRLGRNASDDHGKTGAGILKSKLAKKYMSLAQIRSHRDQLVNYNNEKVNAINDGIRDIVCTTFYSRRLAEEFGLYTAELVSQEYAEDILVKGMDIDKVVERFNREEKEDLSLSEEEKAEIRQLRQDIINLPAFYFETKFERPVYFNEFAAAVVPSDIPASARKALEDYGLPIYEYKEGDNAARSKAVREASEADGIRFSFIGERGARIADNAREDSEKIANLSVAREMETAGKPARLIKQATGWERGADKKWRYELPDDWTFDTSGNVAYRKRNPDFARWEELIRKRNLHAFYPEDHADLTAEEEAQFDKLDLIYSHPASAYKDWRNPHHNSSRVKDYIDAPELFEAYPGLANVEVRWEEMEPYHYGSMNYGDNVIKLNKSLRMTAGPAKSALAHEMQHWIQEVEGFAGGTSLEAAERTAQRMSYDPLTPYQRKFMNDVQSFLDMKAYFDAKGVVPTDNNLAVWMKGSAGDYDPDFAGDYILNATAEEMMKEYERLREKDKSRRVVRAIDVYHNTAGEVEARNVQSRLVFNEFQRMNTLAESTEDVARKDQIVRFTDWGFSRGGLVTPEFVAAQAAQKVPGRDYSEGETDGVRFSLSNNNRKTVTSWLSKRKDLTDKQRKAVIDYLDAMDNPKLQLATAKWFAQGTIRLPEDMYKVEQAVSVSTKAKVDPLQYASPMELLDDHADIRPTEKRIDPNTVSTLHKAKEYPDYGIVVYDVDEGEQSRQNMREIINTHFGKEASPWCLLQGDGNGKLTRESKEYWHGYNAYPKQVAFRNGKLYAFSANDEKTRLWWDRQDNAYKGFPMDMDIPDDALGRSATYTLDPETGKLSSPKGKHRGNKKNGLYEEWNDWDVLIARFNYRDGRRFGLQETFYSGGEPCVRETFGERGENLGDYTVWYANGQLKNEWHFNEDGRGDGLQRSYHANGQLHEERPMVDGKKEGIVQMWNDKGQLVVRQEYADDRRNGLEQTWSDNGTPETEINYKDGLRDGPSRVYWAGRLIREATYKKDMVVGEQKNWYESGNIKSIRHFDDEGFLHGEQVEYYDFVGREEVFYRKNYNHGELDGPSEEWWDKDKPKLRETWSNGKHVGLFEEWYPNGVLKWRRNYNDKGQLDGVSEQYTAGGTLFERYTYKDGEIVEYRTGREVALEAENEGGVSFSIVSDKDEIERLEKIPTTTLYRAMELIDGALYPPMSQKIPNVKGQKGGKLQRRQGAQLGQWEKADEDPSKAYQKKSGGPWYYDLKKIKGSDVNGVLYNPYLHLSASPLNDQFSAASQRPNLVTVACEVPITELSGRYKAEKANDPIGAKDWHSGTVTAQLGEGRQVVLSRWAKPVRIVSDSEVASLVAPKLVAKGIIVPDNVVTPSLKAALERKGVKFSALEEDEDGVKFSVVSRDMDEHYRNAVDKGYTQVAGQLVKQAAKAAMPYTVASDENGNPLVVYHGTPSEKFTEFMTPGEDLQGLIWVTPEKRYAETYADWRGIGHPESLEEPDNGNGRLYPLFVNIQNPLDIGYIEDVVGSESWNRIAERFGLKPEELFYKIEDRRYGLPADYEQAVRQMDYIYDYTRQAGFVKLLKQYGYDGVVAEEEGINKTPTYGVVSPSQVKSAEQVVRDDEGFVIPLSERFNPNEGDIRFSVANRNQEIFVSNAQKAVKDIKNEKATPEQWLKQLEKGGLKAGEDKWLGLSDWLKASDKKTLTKQEILDFIAQNRIEIEEQHYSETASKGYEEALRSYQEEFDELAAEGEDVTGSIYVADHYDYAWKQMLERYGDDFSMAFEMEGAPGNRWNLVPLIDIFTGDEYTDAARYFLEQRIADDIPDRIINGTRLNYTTEGLDNKREIALTVPTIEPWNENDAIHFGDAGEGRAVAWIRFGDALLPTEKIEDREKAYADASSIERQYWQELMKKYPDVVTVTDMEKAATKEEWDKFMELHRASDAAYDRTKYEGIPKERVLFIDEIQSKRHQEGREKGYMDGSEVTVKRDPERDGWNYYFNGEHRGYMNDLIAPTESDALRLAQSYYKKGVPAAPFEKNWHELALKRMLRLAAEEGYDYVAWTTGEQQAERYTLSNTVKSISSSQDGDDKNVNIELFNRNYTIKLKVDGDGHVTSSNESEFSNKSLSEIVGKDNAQKLLAEDTTINGDNLKIGGEGMRGFYDEILPRFMNKYGKKWGVKVEDIELPNLDNRENLPAHAVRVTDEMRESVMAGQPMFSVKDGQPPVKREGEDEYEYLQRSLDHLGKKYRWQVAGRIIGTKPARAESERGIPDEFGAYDSGRIRIFVRKGETYEYGTHELAFFHENFHAWLDKNGHAGNSPFVVGLLRELREKGLVTNLDAKAEELKAAGYKDEDINEELAVRVVSDVMRRGLATRLEDNLSEGLNNVLNEYYNAIGYDKAEETSTRRGTGSESRGRAVQDPDSTEEPGRAGAGLPGEAGGGRDASARGDVGGNDGETRGDRFSKENAVTNTAAVLGVEVEFLPASEMTVNGRRLAGRWQDGKISICLQNCRDARDAARTVVHEAVGHEGLRKLVGAQNMREFCLSLYHKLPREASDAIANAAITKYGGNFVEATEEWLAERAEDMDFGKGSGVWDTIRAAVRDLLRKVGVDLTFSERDVRWLLWQSYYANKDNEMMTEVRRRVLAGRLGFSIREQEDRAGAETVTRRREAEQISAARIYNMAVQAASARLHEVFVDKDDSLNRLVDAIEQSSGRKAKDFEDVRLALNQQSSKGLAATEKFIREKYEPMMEAIKAIVKAGDLSVEDVERYVKIKHGIERNEVFAKRDARNYYKAIADKEISRIKDSEAEEDLKDSLIEREKSKLDRHLEKVDKGADPKYREFREKDYGGLTAMYSNFEDVKPYDEGVESYEEYQARVLASRKPAYDTLEETEAAAEREVRSFEESVGSVLTDELWKRINAATKSTLLQQYKSNMMSRRQYETVRDMFKFYVPLRGFKDNTAADMYNYYMSDNSGEFTPPLLKAGGRKTESESPFGYIGSMASSAITEGVKNESKLALYYFITNRPDNDLMSSSEVWYENTGITEDGRRIFSPAYPPITQDLSAGAARKAFIEWEEAMKAKARNGYAYKGTKNIDLNNSVINIDDSEKNEHIIRFKINGEERMMFINGNPRAAQALNNLLNVNAAPSELVAGLQKILRYVAAVNTQLNPEFWMTNLQRDLLFATMSQSAKENKEFNRLFHRNLVAARRVLKLKKAYEKGTLGTSQEEQYYREFVENGGVTGYSRVIGTEEWENEVRKFNKEEKKAVKAFLDVLHVIGDFGEAIEQMTRFAAYRTSRETGKGVIDSVADAKELTVNFNRKGSGIALTFKEAEKLRDSKGRPLSKVQQLMVVAASSLGAYARSAIVFFNAAVQGLNNMVKLYKKNRRAMLMWTAGYFVLGALNAVMHALLDDDDNDDYLDMPANERRNNLVLGYDGVYFKWALPQEARVFYGAGDILVNHVLGRTPDKTIAGELLSAVGEVSPIDISSGVSALAPSITTPIVEIIRNEDWTGGRVYNERRFLSKEEREHRPKYRDPLKNTPDMYVWMSEALNAISGGNTYEGGALNWDPNIIEHLVEGYTGGLGTSLEKFFVLVGNTAQGRFVVRDTPFLRRLLSINDERYRNAHVTELYYYYKGEAENTRRIYKEAMKAGDEERVRKITDSKDFRIMQIYESFKSEMKTLDDDLKAVGKDQDEEKKEIMRRQDALRKEMIRQISELK